ncbi:MAG: LamG domain-containing protein [Candidatus Woesearchaeota archaeon]
MRKKPTANKPQPVITPAIQNKNKIIIITVISIVLILGLVLFLVNKQMVGKVIEGTDYNATLLSQAGSAGIPIKAAQVLAGSEDNVVVGANLGPSGDGMVFSFNFTYPSNLVNFTGISESFTGVTFPQAVINFEKSVNSGTGTVKVTGALIPTKTLRNYSISDFGDGNVVALVALHFKAVNFSNDASGNAITKPVRIQFTEFTILNETGGNIVTKKVGATFSIVSKLAGLTDTITPPDVCNNTIAPAGMVGYWALNEGKGLIAYDSYGSNNGTINGLQWQSFASDANRIELNFSQSGSVKIPDSDSLDLTGDMSIELWVNPGETQKQYADILSKHTPGGYAIEQNDNNVNQYAFGWAIGKDPDVWANATGTVQLTANTWQHLAIVKTGADVTYYLNGVKNFSSTGAGENIAINNNPLKLGDWAGGSNRQFNGMLSDVAIYSRALTIDEVKAHYTSSTKGEGYCVAGTGLLGDVDGIDGVTIFDALAIVESINAGTTANLPSAANADCKDNITIFDALAIVESININIALSCD